MDHLLKSAWRQNPYRLLRQSGVSVFACGLLTCLCIDRNVVRLDSRQQAAIFTRHSVHESSSNVESQHSVVRQIARGSATGFTLGVFVSSFSRVIVALATTLYLSYWVIASRLKPSGSSLRYFTSRFLLLETFSRDSIWFSFTLVLSFFLVTFGRI